MQRWPIVVLLIAGALVCLPFAPWLMLAIWFGLYARRLHRRIARRLRGRSGLAAAITVILVVAVVLPLAALLTSIVIDTVALVRQLLDTSQARTLLERLVESGANHRGSQAHHGLVDLLISQGDRAWALAGQVAGAAAHFAIGLVLMIVGMYGVLVEGPAWFAWLDDHLPLPPGQFRRYADVFVETGRGLWFGIIGAGMLQAIVATIAYIALDVPSALALGMLTLVCSLIPAVGTALVWVPVAAGLALTGQPISAIVLGVIGVSVISTIDNIARPYLARRGRLQLPTWVVLIAMFGGIELIGSWGLIVGPVVVRLAKEALVIAAEARQPARSGEAVETTEVS